MPPLLFNVVYDQTATDPTTDNDKNVLTGGAPTPDALINLLPFSDASGLRYRYGLRILDTSAMANLNVGDPTSSGDAAGQYLTGFPLALTTTPPNNMFPPPATPTRTSRLDSFQTFHTPAGRRGSPAFSRSKRLQAPHSPPSISPTNWNSAPTANLAQTTPRKLPPVPPSALSGLPPSAT